MSDSELAAAVALARARRNGLVAATGLPIAAMEREAEAAGRQLHVVVTADGEPVLVLGWSGSEPVASTQAPRLSRRRMTASMIKCLVVAWALLHDVGHPRSSVATEDVVRVLDRLTGRSSRTWAIPAVEDALPRVGLMESDRGRWRAGPAATTWDEQTREVMVGAVRRLHEHPGWREAAGG